MWQHSWVRNGPTWHERGVNCYEVTPDPGALGGLRCDEQVVAELESAGYPRSSLVQYLIAGEANHLTASYFLLCESKADAMRKLRASTSHGHRGSGSSSAAGGSSSAGGGGGGGSSSHRSSSVTPGSAAAAGYSAAHGSAQVAAAVAKARAAAGESPGRSSRPTTAVGASGYSSARGGRSDRHAEDYTPGRTAVAV